MIIHAWAAGYISGMPLKSGQLKTVSQMQQRMTSKTSRDNLCAELAEEAVHRIIFSGGNVRSETSEVKQAAMTW